jgi:hypothetical protein
LPRDAIATVLKGTRRTGTVDRTRQEFCPHDGHPIFPLSFSHVLIVKQYYETTL